jgi:hypothetical protein
MLKKVKAKEEVRQDGLQAGATESVQAALRTRSKSKKGCPA